MKKIVETNVEDTIAELAILSTRSLSVNHIDIKEFFSQKSPVGHPAGLFGISVGTKLSLYSLPY